MLVQVVEIEYFQDARGADWATARNALPRLYKDRLPVDEQDYALVQYVQAQNTSFRLRQSIDQHRPELKTYGVMPTKRGVRILPARPTWGLPKREHQPSFEKDIPVGTWARYQTNARHAGYDGTCYFEWSINIAHPLADGAQGIKPFQGEPIWCVDLRAELF